MQYFQYGKKEIDYLKTKDERMAKLIERVGHIERPLTADLYTCLVHQVTGQQISTSAHKTIINRLNEKVGKVTPENIFSLTDEELKSIGITYRKADYIKSFTKKIIDKEFDIDALQYMDNQQVILNLTSLKGIGQWTAEMVMIFSMGRMNVMSYNDLAIRRGICRLHNLSELSVQEFNYYDSLYSPYQSVASLYLWHYANPKCDFTI